MRTSKLLILFPMALIAAACGRNSSPAADDALKTDLALASQAQSPQPVISPTEAGYANQPQTAPRQLQSTARQVSHSSSRRTSSARSSGSRSSGGYYPAPTPRTTVEKHTQRDAAIGAAGGAVIGAMSSRNKVKGGIIGAAVGGILGGVIGNNVDIQKKTIPY